MTISIKKQPRGYVAMVNPPNSRAPWRSDKEMSADQLIAQLKSMGVDETAIYDALAKADPSRYSLFKPGFAPRADATIDDTDAGDGQG